MGRSVHTGLRGPGVIVCKSGLVQRVNHCRRPHDLSAETVRQQLIQSLYSVCGTPGKPRKENNPSDSGTRPPKPRRRFSSVLAGFGLAASIFVRSPLFCCICTICLILAGMPNNEHAACAKQAQHQGGLSCQTSCHDKQGSAAGPLKRPPGA